MGTIAAAADPEAARELALWAANDGPSYRARTLPTYRNLERRWRAGTYRRELAVPFMAESLVTAARSYAVEFASSALEWAELFPPATRRLAALELLEHAEAEWALENWFGA